MNFQKKYDKKNENLLLAPIYKLNFVQRSSHESQTSATGSGSENSLIKIKKNLKKNKTYSLLNFQTNQNIFSPHKFERKNLINIENNNNNLFKKSLLNNNKDNYIDSVDIMNFSNNKSRNNKVLNNIKPFNIKSTSDLIMNNSSNNYQTQIQKILKKHKINLAKRKLEIPNLLIKDSDITKKRYYFGFMSFENINQKDSSNKNILSEKKIISKSPNLKKKIIPLKKKPKISIDELIKKKFPESVEKNLIEKIKNPKKIKLKLNPLRKTINIKLKELKKIIPENNLKKNFDKLSTTNNLKKNLKLTQCKSYEKINNESKTERNKRNSKKKFTNLKHINKKISSSTKHLPKILKFESKPINLIEMIENKKVFSEEKEIDEINEINITKFGYNFDIEEQSSREYEEDNDINSEDNFIKKRKKILKEKMKFSIKTSSPTLILNKTIIESYEFFNFTKQEKKFLINLYPDINKNKKLLSDNYNQILNKSKKYIKELIHIKEKNLFGDFKFKIKMFLECKNELLDEIKLFLFNYNVINFRYYKYLSVGLNTSISYHFMNLYLPMSPQIIDNFLTAKPEEKDKDCKYIFTNKVNITKRKSCPDIHNQLIYDLMALKKENLVFFQKFIYYDYIDNNLLFVNFKNLIKKEERYNKEENDIEKEKNLLKKKANKKKVKLQILRKKFFFKMEGKQRHIMDSQFDNFFKSEDTIVQSLLESINEMIKSPKYEPKLTSTIMILLDYCIKYKSTTLFIAIHHRYHKFFNLNSIDEYQNNDTLLIKATKEKSKGIVKYLLEKGANPNICNDFGNTPIHYALSNKYFEIADILRKNGANENIENNKGLISWECINQKCE